MECKFLTKQAPHPFPFSHGVIVPGPGRLIFLSGQVAYDRHGPDRKLVGPGDVAAQARQAFENIKTLLSQAGANLRNIVDHAYQRSRPSNAPVCCWLALASARSPFE